MHEWVGWVDRADSEPLTGVVGQNPCVVGQNPCVWVDPTLDPTALHTWAQPTEQNTTAPHTTVRCATEVHDSSRVNGSTPHHRAADGACLLLYSGYRCRNCSTTQHTVLHRVRTLTHSAHLIQKLCTSAKNAVPPQPQHHFNQHWVVYVRPQYPQRSWCAACALSLPFLPRWQDLNTKHPDCAHVHDAPRT